MTGNLGQECSTDEQCGGGQTCHTDFPEGYCTDACATDADCADGLCVADLCLAACGTDADCRPDYSCVHTAEGRVCAPPGHDLHGFGDQCTGDDDCADPLTCELVSPDGSQCTEPCTSVLNCGAGAACVNDLCRLLCGGDDDCQGDQLCLQTADGRICAPMPPLSPLGGPCAGNNDCAAGLTCLTDAPDGYCTRECTGPPDCPDGVCHAGFCFAGCNPSASETDVLFVVDDSPGMAMAQSELIAAAPTLIGAFDTAGVEYRLGVVSTDVAVAPYTITNCDDLSGVLQNTPQGACEAPAERWITPTNVTDPAAAFACIAALGDQGCGFEQPLEALQRALSDAVNPGFIRAAAHLMVVILTTEDDCSASDPGIFDDANSTFGPFSGFRCFEHGIACDGVSPNFTNCRTKPAADGGVLHPVSRYVSQLQGLKGDLANVTLVVIAGPRTPVSVVLGPPDNVAPSCDSGLVEAQPGIRLGEFLDVVGGSFFDVCTADYGQIWQPLIDQVSEGACRTGYDCTVTGDGAICEPE